jgi:hypothetical protein
MIKIGVVVHGPEVVDSGNALLVLKRLESLGRVTAVLGGTMGRVAVIDAGLEEVIEISQRRTPSQSIRSMQSFADLVVLLNQAKTRETGLAFGAAVSDHACVTLPVVQVDCGGLFVTSLSGVDDQYARTIADILGLELLAQPANPMSIIRQGNLIKRSLTGVLPGELISINGIVVAKATSNRVEIHFSKGKIIDFIGAKPKIHGIEKLQMIDCEKAIIRSGDIRRTEGELKAKPKPGDSEHNGLGAVIIDHCAEDAFEMARDVCVAVTIGDDTTAIAADILARLGVPIIGVVDGDLDRLSHKTAKLMGSVLIRVHQGFDDIIGKQIKDEVFMGNSHASMKPGELLERITEIAGSRTEQIEKV